MENINYPTVLRNEIQRLEVEQAILGQQLKEQFDFTFESLKPVNLFRNTLYEAASSPHLINNILGMSVGLATGFLSKKIVVGFSGNIIRRLFGSVLQLGVTNTVAHHPNSIKSFGHYIFQHIFRKKGKEL